MADDFVYGICHPWNARISEEFCRQYKAQGKDRCENCEGLGMELNKDSSVKKKRRGCSNVTIYNQEELSAIFDRIYLALNARRQIDLARALGVSGQAVSNVVTSGKLPLAWLYKVSVEQNISLDWLVYGVGSKDLRLNQDTTGNTAHDSIMPEVNRILELVEPILKSLRGKPE